MFRVVCLSAAAVSLALCAWGHSEATRDFPAGQEIFLTHCYGCHTLGAAGTPIAPDLSHVGARLNRDQIERRLRDPRTHKPTARMPKIDLSEVEVQILATYLSELRWQALGSLLSKLGCNDEGLSFDPAILS